MKYTPYSAPVVGVILFGALLIVSLGWAGIYSTYLNQPSGPLTSQKQVALDNRGIVTQAGKVVGRAVPEGKSQKVRLKMIGDPSMGDMFLTSVSLPSNVTAVEGGFASIQGTGQMTTYPEGQGTLVIDAGVLLPESHSVVTLTFPEGTFAVPAWLRVIDMAGSWPLPTLGLVAVLLIGGVIGYVLLVTKKFHPQNAKAIAKVPDKLAPLEVAVLSRGELAADDISSLVYGLAEAGWLQIIQKDDEVLFYRDHGLTQLLPYEDAILGMLTHANGQPKGLSEVVSGLNNRLFSRIVGAIYFDIYERLLSKGYVEEDLSFIHLRFKTAGIILQLYSVIVVAACYLIGGAALYGYIYVGLAGYLAGVILYKSGYRIVPLTFAGQEALTRFAQLNAYFRRPEPVPLDVGGMRSFYHLLPYALVGGSTEQWLRRFDHQALLIPAWFTAENGYYYPMDFLAQIKEVGARFANLFAKVKDPNVD